MIKSIYLRFPFWIIKLTYLWYLSTWRRTDHFREWCCHLSDIHRMHLLTMQENGGITGTGWCFDGDWGAANTLKGIQLYKLISLPLSICLGRIKLWQLDRSWRVDGEWSWWWHYLSSPPFPESLKHSHLKEPRFHFHYSMNHLFFAD